MTRTPRSREERSRRLTIGMCVLASVVFWFSTKLSQAYTTLEPISVDYRLPQGLAFANEPPAELTATVEASGWDLLAQVFRRGERSIVIDSLTLVDNPDGVVNVRREVADAFRDEGLRVDALTNERIILRTERVATKRVPVYLAGTLEYAQGFLSAEAPRITPDSVTVSGPGSVLEQIAAWPTDSLDVSGVRDTFTTTITVSRPAAANLSVTPRTVDISVYSEQFTEKSMYLPVAPAGVSVRDSVSFFPRQVLVTFAIGLEEYASVSPADFEAVANLEGFDLGASPQVAVTLTRRPSRVRGVNVKPRMVEVYLHTDTDPASN